MTADIIASINAFFTLLLVILTAVYVVLTHRLTVQAKEASKDNIALQNQHARISFFPKLSCRVDQIGQKLVLKISNPCDHPAYDVEVFAVLGYDEESIDVPTFAVKYLHEKFRQHRVEPTADGFYGVVNFMAYADFPGRRRIEVPLDTPIIPNNFHLLIQFRDLIGYNYAQTYWFFSDGENGARNYKLGALTPIIPTPIPRIERDVNKLNSLKMADKSLVSAHIDQEFNDLFVASFPSGYLIGTVRDVEDRGVWHDQ